MAKWWSSLSRGISERYAEALGEGHESSLSLFDAVEVCRGQDVPVIAVAGGPTSNPKTSRVP